MREAYARSVTMLKHRRKRARTPRNKRIALGTSLVHPARLCSCRRSVARSPLRSWRRLGALKYAWTSQRSARASPQTSVRRRPRCRRAARRGGDARATAVEDRLPARWWARSRVAGRSRDHHERPNRHECRHCRRIPSSARKIASVQSSRPGPRSRARGSTASSRCKRRRRRRGVLHRDGDAPSSRTARPIPCLRRGACVR
jgi:hypothetical protein